MRQAVAATADHTGPARAAFVERMAGEFVRAGMPRMPSRVFSAIVASDAGRMTAAELAQTLQASPAAISGAVRYLEQVNMLTRLREPGTRHDVFSLGDDIWYEALAHRDGVLTLWQNTMADGAAALGPDSTAGRRMAEMQEFFAFMAKEMPGLLERWRAHREGLRTD